MMKEKVRRKPDKPVDKRCVHIMLGSFVAVFFILVAMTYIIQQPATDLLKRRQGQTEGPRRSIEAACKDKHITAVEQKLCKSLIEHNIDDLQKWVAVIDELEMPPNNYIVEVAQQVLASLEEQSLSPAATLSTATKRPTNVAERIKRTTPVKRASPAHRGDDIKPAATPQALSSAPAPTAPPAAAEPSAASVPSNDKVPAAPSLLPSLQLDVSKLKYATNSFPIAIMACNRLNMIQRSLPSLLAVEGITPEQVTVYMDGNDQGVTDYVRSVDKVNLVQNVGAPAAWDGAVRISQHYKWSLSHIFDHNPNAPMIIVVEDDMIFAPDFLLYFSQLAPLYDMDPSIYCISSWNDNGFKGMVRDPLALRRTEFFIGLGWLVHRKHYKVQWEASWPRQHWDHWLRDPKQRQGRECVYPEVSRNYNIGKEGTFVDAALFARYFENIVLNNSTDSLGDITRMTQDRYEDDIHNLISNSYAVGDAKELASYKHKSLVIYYEARDPADNIWEVNVAPFFSIWHSQPFIRGVHNGMHRLWWKSNHVILIAGYSIYAPSHKNSVPWWTPSHFVSPPRASEGLLIFMAEAGQNCDLACSKHERRCDKASLAAVNTCTELQRINKCSKCEPSSGGDQPAMITHPSRDPSGNHPANACLYNARFEDLTCSGAHRVTSRLCACF